MLSDRNREYKFNHGGGFGLGWIAIAMVISALILHPGTARIDCFLGVTKACTQISETYK